MPGMVTEVSAIFVDTTTFLACLGVGSNTCVKMVNKSRFLHQSLSFVYLHLLASRKTRIEGQGKKILGKALSGFIVL